VTSRRILVTGISSYWGGNLARRLEQRPEVETVVGVDTEEPRVELERTEFVRVGNQHRLLRRIIEAAAIDTVVDTRLIVDSAAASPHATHENNVIGTMNILAGCSAPDTPVRKFVFKSSAHFYGCEQDDPAFFTEEMRRPHPPRTLLEKDIVEAERAVADFAERCPQCTTTILRTANKIGPDLETSHGRVFSLPLVPTILGFDPRYQFIHEDDVVGVLDHVVARDVPGVYNAAADGVLVLSEVLDLLDRRWLPIIPPWGTDAVANRILRPLGVRITPEMVRQLRYGRGLDNRKLKATGYQYRHTTREALTELREHQRTTALLQGREEGYVYEREVEEFLRWSPSVQDRRTPRAIGTGTNGDAPLAAYDDLGSEEVLAVLPSLRREDLEELRRYEAGHGARGDVLRAIDRHLGRVGPG
jgi:UDP-glucose 4-epimerase